MKIGLYCVQPRLQVCLETALKDRGYGVETLDSTTLSSTSTIGCGVIGVGFPIDSALELCRRFRAVFPRRIPLLVLGPWLDSSAIHDLLAAGASDYLPAAWHTRELDIRLAVLAGQVTETDPRPEKEKSPHATDAQRLEGIEVFAGSVAHDVNNVLAAIVGNTELALLELDSQSPARFSLEQIEHAAHRAAELTRRLMDYSRRRSAKIVPINLAELVSEMGQLLRASLSPSCRIEYSLDTDSPLILGEPSQLRQVALNLLINASDALSGQPGTIHVRVLRHDSPKGLQVALTVSDSGLGMSDEVRSRIFDTYFTTKATGSGLGLAAVQHIVRSHGGTIEVESQLGSGSIFRLTFPAAPANAPEANTTTPEPDWLGGGTVLLIEDDPAVRNAARLLLRKAGYTVLEAACGEEGVDMFSRYQSLINAVILDLNLRGNCGTNVLRDLRKIRPSIRVIIWSAMDMDSAREMTEGSGVSEIVTKPSPIRDLAATVRRVLKQSHDSAVCSGGFAIEPPKSR